jgi:hypothetical protein
LITAKNRKAHLDFLKAIEASTQNHSFEAIELLSSELAELNKIYSMHCPELKISGQWVMQNLSYAAAVDVSFAGKDANLLKFIAAPLTRTEAMLVVHHSPYHEGEHGHQLRSHKIFKKLDDNKGVGKLFGAVRSHIEDVVPQALKAILNPLMQEPTAPDIPEGHIEAKYGGHDPAKAFKDALYYQDTQHAGLYARMP